MPPEFFRTVASHAADPSHSKLASQIGMYATPREVGYALAAGAVLLVAGLFRTRRTSR